MAMTNGEDGIDAIEALLPWYAAGTLGAQDAKRVEEALARRPELRASLRLAQEDLEETIALNERLGAPGASALDKIMATVQAEPRSLGFESRLSAWLGVASGRSSSRLAWAGAAATVVILVQGAALVTLLPRANTPAYQTASESAVVPGGAQALVTFAPDARMDQIGAWLDAHHARIVDGPRGGMYRLRVGDKRFSTEETAALLAELGKAPFVSLVLPATGD
jgi:anti-sigma-K factor RskA